MSVYKIIVGQCYVAQCHVIEGVRIAFSTYQKLMGYPHFRPTLNICYNMVSTYQISNVPLYMSIDIVLSNCVCQLFINTHIQLRLASQTIMRRQHSFSKYCVYISHECLQNNRWTMLCCTVPCYRSHQMAVIPENEKVIQLDMNDDEGWVDTHHNVRELEQYSSSLPHTHTHTHSLSPLPLLTGSSSSV